MLIVHNGKRPEIDPTAWVAPDATVCGNVVIGAGSRVLYGARVIGEGGGSIRVGDSCIVMENAVIRATQRHNCTIGNHCLIGPNAHVTGAVLEEQVFIATGAAVFHGAHIGRESTVRVHAIVHLRTRLAKLKPPCQSPGSLSAVRRRFFRLTNMMRSGPFRSPSISPNGCMALIAARRTLWFM